VKLTDLPNNSSARIASESTTTPLGGAEKLDVVIRSGVGVVNLHAADSSATALVGKFHTPVEWLPEIKYSVDGSAGVLDVRQPEAKPQGLIFGDVQNSWDVGLAPAVPTDLTLELGVGETTARLRGIDLTKLRVIAGVGRATLDLTGPRTHDLNGRIECGMGDMHLIVPEGVGVRLTGINEGLGNVKAPDFRQSGDALVNSAWEHDGPKIDLDVTHGLGDLDVVVQ
jgi:hypothetical protein